MRRSPTLPNHTTPPVTSASCLSKTSQQFSPLLHACLPKHGYNVVSAPDGNVAVELASRERFDILVTDVVMPGLNGRELAQTVTALQPDIAVLYTSGYPDQELESRDIVGAVSLLRKPYSAEALAGAVRQTLELRLPALSETPLP